MATDHVQSGIDLNEIAPLDHHQSAVTFNCFILKMTEVLNNFGNRMEDVLDRAEKTLDTADRKLRLMEAKLAAVKLEEDNSQDRISSKIETAPIVGEKEETLIMTTSKSVEVADFTDRKETFESSTVQACLIKNDPLYSKYFKMLKMGVPEVGVIQKMESEGVDPSILKRGDEPSENPKTSGYESSGDSVSSFSDSD